MAPYMIHVTPNICMVFLVYEHLTDYVERKRNEIPVQTDVTVSAVQEPVSSTLSQLESNQIIEAVISMECDSM